MKLYFYFVESRLRENDAPGLPEIREYVLSVKEVDVRETQKLYLPATQDAEFPCYKRRLLKKKVDTGGIDNDYLIFSKPDEEAARAIWRRDYLKNAAFFDSRAEAMRRQAQKCRKIAAYL